MLLVVRIFAHLVSVLFHPLLIVTYMLLVMLVVNPYMFGYNAVSDADKLILMVFLTSVLIPVIAILVMKGIGWIRSFEMTDKYERIGPYLVTSVLYLSLYLHLAKTKAFPSPLLVASLGAVIALFAGFFLNNFKKVSMHAIAISGFAVLMCFLYLEYSEPSFLLHLPFLTGLQVPSVFLIYAGIIVAGIVCSARLIVDMHTSGEVYLGAVTGAVSMTMAYLIIH